MSKRDLVLLVVAVLVVGVAAVVIASSFGGSSEDQGLHLMPNGQTMQGPGMGDGSTSGMPTTQHQMPGGQTMPGAGGSGTDGGMDMGH